MARPGALLFLQDSLRLAGAGRKSRMVGVGQRAVEVGQGRIAADQRFHRLGGEGAIEAGLGGAILRHCGPGDASKANPPEFRDPSHERAPTRNAAASTASQPAIINTPPIGVIIASQSCPVQA